MNKSAISNSQWDQYIQLNFQKKKKNKNKKLQ